MVAVIKPLHFVGGGGPNSAAVMPQMEGLLIISLFGIFDLLLFLLRSIAHFPHGFHCRKAVAVFLESVSLESRTTSAGRTTLFQTKRWGDASFTPDEK